MTRECKISRAASRARKLALQARSTDDEERKRELLTELEQLQLGIDSQAQRLAAERDQS